MAVLQKKTSSNLRYPMLSGGEKKYYSVLLFYRQQNNATLAAY